MIRVHPANAAYDFDTGFEWAKGIAIGDMQLRTTAEFIRKFLKRGLEKNFAEIDPGSFKAFNSRQKFSGSIQGRPKISNGRVVAAPLGEFVPSKQHIPGLNVAV